LLDVELLRIFDIENKENYFSQVLTTKIVYLINRVSKNNSLIVFVI